MKRIILTALVSVALLLVIVSPVCAEYYPGLETQLNGVVNVNNAGVDDLLKLGLTAEQADNILHFREISGAFVSVDDLLKVEGISQADIDKIRSYLRTDGKTHIYYSDSGS